MKASRQLRWLGCALIAAGALYGVGHAQRPFRQYPSVEYGWREVPLPPDYNKPAEWTFARLMFPSGPLDGYRGRFDGDWRLGLTLWTQDYPRADRHFAAAVRRLTRVDARSAEQPVMLEDINDIYNWPFIYAVQVGEWGLTQKECNILRDYLLRGGFLMADDFWGPEEDAYFIKTMRMVFPDRPIEEIPNNDPIFHTIYDLDKRYRITGWEHLDTGYKNGGKVPRWECIRDDHGRIMVAISLNSDIGDSWEWDDTPRYPQKFSDLGIRIGVNYVVYDMTH